MVRGAPKSSLSQKETGCQIGDNMDKIARFQKLPNYKQKSQLWLDQRSNYLTASTIAVALRFIGSIRS